MTAITTLAILRALLFTAEALALSTLLPLVVFAVALALRRRAALRHLVWLAAFAMLLLAPALALIVPSQFVLADAPPLGNYMTDMPSVPVAVAMAAPVTATYVHEWSFDQIVALLFAPLCAIWLLGVAWNLMRLGLGAYGLRRLRGRSEYFDTVENCELRLADGGPLTYGWLKPVILLPHAARRWSVARLDAVLRHEMAHVRRKDSLTQTLVQLVCAFYWPNPLVWLAARALRREAEIAADDSVLASGLKPSSYAAELLQLAGELRGSPLLAGVAMAAPSSLESRVTAVLSPTVSREGATVMDAFKIALLGSCATALLLVTRPSFAEPRKPVPLPVALAAPSAPVQAAAPPAPVASMIPPTPVAPPAPVHRHVRVVVDADMPSQAEIERQVERAHDRAQAALERAKEKSEQAMSPERVEQIMAHAQERAQHAVERYDDAMQRATDETRHADHDVQESVRQSMIANRPDIARIVAQVRVQVANALAQARIARTVALKQAQVEIDRSLSQARAQARSEAHAAARSYREPPEPPEMPQEH